MVWLLAVAVLTGGCRSTDADLVDPTTPPATTTTTAPDPPSANAPQAVDPPGDDDRVPGADATDAGVAQDFFDAFSSGDADGWLSLMAQDTVVVDGDEEIGLFDPLPPDLGVPDWNDDGRVAVLDIILQQSAFAVITGNDVDTICAPDGPEVACTVNETDVFYDAAGIAAPTVIQRFTILGERIIEIGSVDVVDPAAADAAFGTWIEQFGAFEEWVSNTYPDRFDPLFTSPCCVGLPETLNLVPGTVDELAALLQEWSAAQA